MTAARYTTSAPAPAISTAIEAAQARRSAAESSTGTAAVGGSGAILGAIGIGARMTGAGSTGAGGSAAGAGTAGTTGAALGVSVPGSANSAAQREQRSIRAGPASSRSGTWYSAEQDGQAIRMPV